MLTCQPIMAGIGPTPDNMDGAWGIPGPCGVWPNIFCRGMVDGPFARTTMAPVGLSAGPIKIRLTGHPEISVRCSLPGAISLRERGTRGSSFRPTKAQAGVGQEQVYPVRGALNPSVYFARIVWELSIFAGTDLGVYTSTKQRCELDSSEQGHLGSHSGARRVWIDHFR